MISNLPYTCGPYGNSGESTDFRGVRSDFAVPSRQVLDLKRFKQLAMSELDSCRPTGSDTTMTELDL